MLKSDVRVVATRLDDPVASRLIDDLQADLTVRYGGPDPVPTSPEEFWPPRGAFLVAWIDGEPVGCAGVKELDRGVVELKRMYVAPRARGRGVARALLAELEIIAAAAGASSIRLLTGEAQPEAVRLYESAGWTRTELYGPALEYGWTDAYAYERRLLAPGAVTASTANDVASPGPAGAGPAPSR